MANEHDTFAADVKKFSDKAKLAMPTVVRMIAMEVYGRIIKRTPVDTGRARANWMLSLGNPDLATTESTDKTGQTTLASGLSQVAKYTDGSIWITNNLPYIKRLENGWSKQAPNGMVRLTIAEFSSVVKKMAAQIRETKT